MKMKKMNMFVFAALMLTSVVAKAQNVDFGIKAGVNYGTLPSSMAELKDESGKLGFNVGVFARMGSELYFQPEVNFSTYSAEYTLGTEKFEPKFRSLNVPLMMGYKIVNDKTLKLRVSLGPDFNYALKDPEGPANTEYKKFSAGGVLNAGVDLGMFTIDARYSRGLTKTNEGLDQKSGIFNLSLGFIIR